MTTHDTALRFALLRLLREGLKQAKDSADEDIRRGWKVKDRNAAVLPDGTEIGSVTLASGKTSASVTDEEAFLAWVLETYPEQIEQVKVTRVSPVFVEQILRHARRIGQAVDPATGEEIRGVAVREGDPYPTTTLVPDAADLVAKAWQDGALTELIGSLVQPAIEAGES